MSAGKRINDGIYGNISVSEQELRVIDTPIFQRLRQIKQLGATDMVYPGATHTRFAHSIGTMHMMGQFISGIRRGGSRLVESSEEHEKLRLAALLHDIGHYPYSHTTENVVTRRFKGMGHEQFGELLIKRFLSERLDTYRPAEISDIFTGKEKGVASLLISSALDADKADYLMRDAYHAGVSYGRVSIPRLIRTLSYFKDGIVFEKDEVAVEDFLTGRYHMYRAVYYHKAVVAFNLMVERIFEGLVSEGYMPNPRELARSGDELAITAYTDNLFFAKIHEYLKSGKGRFLKELIRAFLSREPLEPAYLNSTPAWKGSEPSDVVKISAMERDAKEKERFAKMAGVDPEEVFPATMRPLGLIDENTKIYMRGKGGIKPLTESAGLILNMIGSKTMYDARVYAMPGRSRQVAKALQRYLR